MYLSRASSYPPYAPYGSPCSYFDTDQPRRTSLPRSTSWTSTQPYGQAVYESPPLSIEPGVIERLKRKRAATTSSSSKAYSRLTPAGLTSPPLVPLPTLPYTPTNGLVSAEEMERAFLNSISLPIRVAHFVSAFRASLLPASLAFLYPPSDPYPSSPGFDILSLPDPSCSLSSLDAYGTPTGQEPATWVRVPALSPRVDRLSPEMRRRVKMAPALPALATPGQAVAVGADRWTFVKHGPELETSFWDVELEGGTRLKVVFDQAYRG
ncbi:hypothetical protein JCM8097_004011 [Rhodosporidiobolus ruineniae]